MNFDKPLNLKPCCVNLRHKMMYCDERQAVTGFVDSESDTRVYTCVLSQECLGPDKEAVNPVACGPAAGASRACYEGVAVPMRVRGEMKAQS